MHREVSTRGSILDLPERKWFVPDPRFDLGAVHHDHRPATPVGPAAGPHTQMAQNIVLSWLAGGRVIELKTVQVDDHLQIPRPCIRIPNVGYNVEWSQELRVEESILEYVKAAYLIEVLKSTRAFGRFPEGADLETVLDISVGYDLAGIRSQKVTAFLRSMLDASDWIDRLRREIPAEHRAIRDLEVPPRISNCVTLSTFHGCPAAEIESICRYLIEEIGVHTIVKLNPTLLGFERVRELLHDALGYRHLVLRREGFEKDLQYDDAQAMFHRLRRVAEDSGTTIGVKFTNTLIVENDASLFPTQRDPYMYLSGAPLHVISMTLMQRFREDAGFAFPVSFSAGVDAVNFPDTVACGMVPVTSCTDLLKQGSYGRLPVYLRALQRRMEGARVHDLWSYVVTSRGHAAEALVAAVEDWRGGRELWDRHRERLLATASASPGTLADALASVVAPAGLDAGALLLRTFREAGRLNGREIVPSVVHDPRYHAAQNAKAPRKIEKKLALYDCINCDLCIPACPNDAMFAYELTPIETRTTVYIARSSDSRDVAIERDEGRGYVRREAHQLAVYADVCNDCSNCEVFCPQLGAPFLVKERIFSTRDSFEAAVDLDGFFADGGDFLARIDGLAYRVSVDRNACQARLTGGGLDALVDWATLEVLMLTTSRPEAALDTALLQRIKAVVDGVYGAGAGVTFS
jgi:putative selenate reductase